MKLFLREGGVLFNLVFSRLLRTKLIFFFSFYTYYKITRRFPSTLVSFHVKHTKPLNSGLGP